MGICSRIADRRLSVFVIQAPLRLIVAAGRAGKRTGWGAYFSDGNGQLPALGARYDGNLLRLDNGCQVVGHDQQQAAEMADNHPKHSRTGCRSALSNTKRCPKRAASKSDSLTDGPASTFIGTTFRDAGFEREVTSERIRDKIAASKRNTNPQID